MTPVAHCETPQPGRDRLHLSTLRQVDRLQREFEGAASDQIYLDDGGQIGEIVERARRAYRKLMDGVQEIFLRHLEKEGWPPAGRLANADAFDKVIAPLLQHSGRRVALLLIDALRYELGVELHKQLAGDSPVDLQPAFAALPSVTAVGMAALLPGAGQNLTLARQDAGVTPVLGDQTVANVTQRMNVLRQRYGQRFHEVGLLDFVQNKAELPDTVELLVIRSNEMDNDFEKNPDTALNLIVRTFRQVQGAVLKLRSLGFQDAVILTDHGFYLNTSVGPGDACAKPPGNWTNFHERLLLGEGTADSASWVLPAEALGIRGDFRQAAGPRAMVAYQAGTAYLHGGVSLQEALVPVISVRLQAVEPQQARAPAVKLRYKRGGHRITSRRPVFEVEVGAADLFSIETAVEILLEAQDKTGAVVGEASLGGPVNPATRTLSVRYGEMAQVAVKMDEEFQGKFTIRALDPATLKILDKLDMETDYVS